MIKGTPILYFELLALSLAVLVACERAPVSTAQSVDDTSFVTLCSAYQAQTLDAGRATTMHALLKLAHVPNDYCPAAEAALRDTVTVRSGINGPDGGTYHALDLSYRQISDLRPLRYFTYLNELSVRGNAVTDLAPLQALVNLEVLDLSHNQISDLRPLAILARVKYLDVSDNSLALLDGVGGQSSLLSFNAAHNRLSTLDGVKFHQSLISANVAEQRTTTDQASLTPAAIKRLLSFLGAQMLFLNVCRNDVTDLAAAVVDGTRLLTLFADADSDGTCTSHAIAN